MKRILFKGKHTHAFSTNQALNGRWIEGYLSDENYIHSPELEGEFLIDKDTLCQHTGLNACWIDSDNEVKTCDVWEHDLLEIVYEGKTIVAEVKYESGMYILASKYFADSYIMLFDVIDMDDGVSYVDAKHVGNVFDNPELLEECENESRD